PLRETRRCAGCGQGDGREGAIRFRVVGLAANADPHKHRKKKLPSWEILVWGPFPALRKSPPDFSLAKEQSRMHASTVGSCCRRRPRSASAWVTDSALQSLCQA